MHKPSIHLFGDLERAIMDIAWRKGQVTVREVVESIQKKRRIAYTTVMTVMARLAEKGVLSRQEKSGAYVYCPCQAKETFYTTASGKIIRNLLAEFGEVAIAQFVDTLEDVDPKKLRLLEQKIKQKRHG